MELNIDNPLVRWAFWYTDRPRQTTLCALFWRAVLVAPAIVLLGIITIPFWVPVFLWDKYGEAPYRVWRQRRYVVSCEKWHARRLEKPNRHDPPALKILWLGLVSLKKKVCPIITFY